DCACSVHGHQPTRTQTSPKPNRRKPRRYWDLSVGVGSCGCFHCPHNPKVGGSNPSPAIGAASKRPFFIALEEFITPPNLWWAAHQHLVGSLAGNKLGRWLPPKLRPHTSTVLRRCARRCWQSCPCPRTPTEFEPVSCFRFSCEQCFLPNAGKC